MALLLVTPFIFIATRLFSKRVGPLFGNLREKLSHGGNIEAAKIIMQYSNMQTVFAEMPPAYTIVTGTKLKEAG